MKRIFYLIIIMMAGMLAFAFCKGCGKQEETTEDSAQVKIISVDSITAPKVTDVICTIGDGTSMNVLELITEDGDTINIECSDDMVTGGVNVGDKVDVAYITTDLDSRILTCINLTTLEHLWSQKAADGRKQSLELDELGVASTYNMSIDYDRWNLEGGKLLLHSPKQIGSEAAAVCDTFDIMQLDDERLVLMHGNYETEFYREN